VPSVWPLQGPQVFSACVSVGFTYGYSRLSRFSGRRPSLNLAYHYARTGRRKSSKPPNPNFCVAHLIQMFLLVMCRTSFYPKESGNNARMPEGCKGLLFLSVL